MKLACQQDALSTIRKLATNHRQGVLVVGGPGSGKTYIARQYAQLLGISDFYIVSPVMADLREVVTSCASSSTPTVICVENLDQGVDQASAPLLKLIEDCPSHIYIVVTCNNIYGIPDTIPSRCAVVNINPMTQHDAEAYAEYRDQSGYEKMSKTKLWSAVQSLSDIDLVLGFTPEQISYYNDLTRLKLTDPVSTISWKIQHYEDNSPTPTHFVVRYLMNVIGSGSQAACIQCLNDLADNKLSKNAAVSKLVFDLKYLK